MTTKHLTRNPDLRRGFLFLTVAWAAVAAPRAISQDVAAPHTLDKNAPSTRAMAFDAVSIRPSKADEPLNMQWGLPDMYRVNHLPLLATIVMAYFSPQVLMSPGIKDRFLGVPPWAMNDSYDIEAKVAPADVAEWQRQASLAETEKPGSQREMLHSMLQSLLAERCKLVVHRTTTELPTYALVVSKHGPKLQETKPGEMPPADGQLLAGGEGGMIVPYKGGETLKVIFFRTSMASLAAELSMLGAGRPILDKTGLTGKYDFALLKRDTDETSDPTPPSIWDLEAVGLKLVPARAPMETIVIDHIEKPSEN